MVLDVLSVRQREPHDCGRAGARAVCGFLGVRVPADYFPADPMDGIDPGELERRYRGLGLSVVAGNFDLADLRHFTKAGRPVHVPIQADGGGHWVVVKGVGRGKVYVMDPWPDGRQSYATADFLALWSDGTRHGAAYVRWGIAIGR